MNKFVMVTMENVMLNTTVNTTSMVDGALVEIHEAIVNGIQSPVVALVIVFDLLVIAALIADSETVRSIRWILANTLIACVVSALGLLLYHIFQGVSAFDANFARRSQTMCQVVIPVITLGNSGRVLMATFYALTVFIVVRWWNKPVLAPRNTKYFIITAVFVWFLAILLAAPSITTDATTILCATDSTTVNNYTSVYAVLVLLILLSTFPILLTFLFLVITVCFIKRWTITEDSATRKALLKFGFFLVIGQGINVIGQIICPAVSLALSDRDRALVNTILAAFLDLSLIPTPILICIFFKPVWHKLRKWLCSCCRKCSVGTTALQGTTHSAHAVSN